MSATNHRPAARLAAGRASAAPRIIHELANSINRAGNPDKVFYAVLHYIGATAALPDDVKASIFHKLGKEWDSLSKAEPQGERP